MGPPVGHRAAVVRQRVPAKPAPVQQVRVLAIKCGDGDIEIGYRAAVVAEILQRDRAVDPQRRVVGKLDRMVKILDSLLKPQAE